VTEACDILMQQTDQIIIKEFELDMKSTREKVITEIGPELPYENEFKEAFYNFETLRTLLLDERFWTLFTDLKNLKVIKFQQIITSIFFIFLGLTKEEI